MELKEFIKENIVNIEAGIIIIMSLIGAIGGLIDLFMNNGEDEQ